MKTNTKKRVWKRRLQDKAWAGRYLTRALNQGEPEEIQGALYDVVAARGGIAPTAKKAGLSEWRLRLMLFDDEEAAKLVRLGKVMKALGFKLSGVPVKNS